jgi:hypothetical protein
MWSDTEYGTWHYAGIHLLVGLFAAAGFIFLLFRPEQADRLIWSWYWTALLIVPFLLVNPFICRQYYRHRRPVRILLLLVLAVKYVLSILLLYALAMPLVHLDVSQLPALLLSRTNEAIASWTLRLTSLNRGVAMILGIVLGSLQILIRTLLLAVGAVLLPTGSLLAVRQIQHLTDILLCRQLKFPVTPD